jgi:hypothetical protein
LAIAGTALVTAFALLSGPAAHRNAERLPALAANPGLGWLVDVIYGLFGQHRPRRVAHLDVEHPRAVRVAGDRVDPVGPVKRQPAEVAEPSVAAVGGLANRAELAHVI